MTFQKAKVPVLELKPLCCQACDLKVFSINFVRAGSHENHFVDLTTSHMQEVSEAPQLDSPNIDSLDCGSGKALHFDERKAMTALQSSFNVQELLSEPIIFLEGTLAHSA